ncbi:MAG: 5' nucleotidase, NT5C type [Candidatus Nanoarchaeia archaeon]
MKIGFDFDDVIVDFFPTFLDFYNQKYNKKFKIEDITSFYLWEIGIGKNKEESIALIDEFYDSFYFNKIPLRTGAKKGINNILGKGHEIYTITSRPKRFDEKTKISIDNFFSKSHLKLLYSSGMHNKENGTKAEICKNLGIEIIVEDAPKYALECAGEGIKVLLMDRPWNKKLKKGITRVYNWGQIVEKINIFSNKK